MSLEQFADQEYYLKPSITLRVLYLRTFGECCRLCGDCGLELDRIELNCDVCHIPDNLDELDYEDYLIDHPMYHKALYCIGYPSIQRKNQTDLGLDDSKTK